MNDELLHQAKVRAAEAGESLTAFIEDAVRQRLSRERVAPGERVPLPSFAGDGVQPGVDLDDTAALLDLMESD